MYQLIYIDMFWTNSICRMPTFKNENSLAVFCNHPESDVCYSWQVDNSVSGCSNLTNLLRHFRYSR